MPRGGCWGVPRPRRWPTWQRAHDPVVEASDTPLPTGRLGRGRPVSLDAIQVFDVVPPAVLPEQLVAEAQRIARVPVALYVLDIDGTHLLHMAGPKRLGERIPPPPAGGAPPRAPRPPQAPAARG